MTFPHPVQGLSPRSNAILPLAWACTLPHSSIRLSIHKHYILDNQYHKYWLTKSVSTMWLNNNAFVRSISRIIFLSRNMG